MNLQSVNIYIFISQAQSIYMSRNRKHQILVGLPHQIPSSYIEAIINFSKQDLLHGKYPFHSSKTKHLIAYISFKRYDNI